MVTPPSCPGLNVDIIVDGQPLHEYDDINERPPPPNTVTKYIEARSEANFAVRVTTTQDFFFPAGDFEIDVRLDGKPVRATRFKMEYRLDPLGLLIPGRKVRLSPWTSAIRNFRFTALNTDVEEEHDVDESTKQFVSALGVVKIQLQFIKNARKDTDATSFDSEHQHIPVSEKSLKGSSKSHCARLDPPIPMPTAWMDWDYIGSGPFVTVNFNYRSLDMLRVLGIVPREPTPLPLEERPEDELNNDELRHVVRLLKEEREAALEIKKEAANKRARSRSSTVADDDELEIVEAPKRKRRRGEKEVIELD